MRIIFCSCYSWDSSCTNSDTPRSKPNIGRPGKVISSPSPRMPFSNTNPVVQETASMDNNIATSGRYTRRRAEASRSRAEHSARLSCSGYSCCCPSRRKQRWHLGIVWGLLALSRSSDRCFARVVWTMGQGGRHRRSVQAVQAVHTKTQLPTTSIFRLRAAISSFSS